MARFGRYSSTDYMEAAPGAALSFAELMQREKATKGRQDIMKTQAETSAGNLKLAQDKFAAETPAPLKPFKESEMAVLQGGMGAVDKELGTKLVNTTKGVLNVIKNIKAKGGTKLDTYRALKPDWQRHIKPAKEGLVKMIGEAAANEDVEAVEKYGQMLDRVSDEKFLDEMFPITAKFEKDLQKETPELTKGKQFTEVVGGVPQISVPVYDEKMQLSHKVDLGEPYKAEKLYLTTAGYKERKEAIGLGAPTKKEELRTGPIELGTAAKTKVEKGLIEATGGLARLSQIQTGFKPEYQQISTRFSTAWTAGKEKLGIKPPKEDRMLLAEFSEYKRDAINNLNLYIKEITGAQMSEPEAKRLMRGVPNPGKGIFDGDSPTQFKAKLDGTIKQLKVASARFNFIRNSGLSISDVPLSQMPRIINNRAKQLEKQLQANNPNANINQIRQMVKETIAQEFGLVE